MQLTSLSFCSFASEWKIPPTTDSSEFHDSLHIVTTHICTSNFYLFALNLLVAKLSLTNKTNQTKRRREAEAEDEEEEKELSHGKYQAFFASCSATCTASFTFLRLYKQLQLFSYTLKCVMCLFSLCQYFFVVAHNIWNWILAEKDRERMRKTNMYTQSGRVTFADSMILDIHK